jgi:hypothetical protein
MSPLPRYLYRGDSDPHGVRRLKEWERGVLLTNLSNGGSGIEIFSAPLISLVERHIDVGWAKSHFLSFSERYSVAKTFAAGKECRQLVSVNSDPWDCLVLTTDTAQFATVEVLEEGAYRCLYPVTLRVDHQFPSGRFFSYDLPRILSRRMRARRPVEVLVLDCISFLRRQSKDTRVSPEALCKAERDAEWLVLPIDQAEHIPGEFTAALDTSLLSGVERFRFLEHEDK